MLNLFIEPHIASFRTLIAHALGNNILLVCDANTYAALGKRIESEFSSASLKTFLLEKPKASLKDIEIISKQLVGITGILAVGSGTINDLCKYAAYRAGIPYAIAATAPSMNGFISPTASLIPSTGAMKQSYDARPPVAVLAELETLAAAPPRLIQSGLGDSLARPTAQVDWLMSHLVLDTTYDARPFDLVAPYEQTLFEQSSELLKGNLAIIELLFRTLIASGEGMRIAGGSYPASQGEHMIEHTMEMQNGTLPETFHGEQISVTTLTMAEHQEHLLSLDTPPQLKPNASNELSKCSDTSHRKIREALKQWPIIKKQLKAVSLPALYLRDVAKNAGCPLAPQDLGWLQADYETAVATAHTTRDRFTFLDFA